MPTGDCLEQMDDTHAETHNCCITTTTFPENTAAYKDIF